MNLSILTFVLYVIIAGNTTYFLGRSLYLNGESFLKSIFINKPEIVLPANKVLLTGFYLMNVGFVLSFFSQEHQITDFITSLEFLSKKLGIVYVVLGSMHFFNILVFIVIERKFNTNPKHL